MIEIEDFIRYLKSNYPDMIVGEIRTDVTPLIIDGNPYEIGVVFEMLVNLYENQIERLIEDGELLPDEEWDLDFIEWIESFGMLEEVTNFLMPMNTIEYNNEDFELGEEIYRTKDFNEDDISLVWLFGSNNKLGILKNYKPLNLTQITPRALIEFQRTPILYAGSFHQVLSRLKKQLAIDLRTTVRQGELEAKEGTQKLAKIIKDLEELKKEYPNLDEKKKSHSRLILDEGLFI